MVTFWWHNHINIGEFVDLKIYTFNATAIFRNKFSKTSPMAFQQCFRPLTQNYMTYLIYGEQCQCAYKTFWGSPKVKQCDWSVARTRGNKRKRLKNILTRERTRDAVWIRLECVSLNRASVTLRGINFKLFKGNFLLPISLIDIRPGGFFIK